MRIIDYEVIKLNITDLGLRLHEVRVKMQKCDQGEYAELSRDLAVLKAAYNARVRNNAIEKEAELRRQLL